MLFVLIVLNNLGGGGGAFRHPVLYIVWWKVMLTMQMIEIKNRFEIYRFYLHRGSHVMQGNSLLALAGLVCSVFNYQTSIVQNEEEARLLKSTGEIYITAEEWIARVTDAMLVILDGNIKTLGAPMAWCQQVGFYI